ncbi:sugar phosphate isomerase/epimerase family protein [Acidicapsa ligni]|uniref:sugar phosphate isomerase/epimerase family protein n=1 Tax=Acidicapsa ligni TaxID=542300 RepID=UPI0021DF7CA9|nr:sugar phosphate isomerase/epimerase family protein [Acidicapsa ligni]
MRVLSRRRFLITTGGAGAAAVAASLLPRMAVASPMGLPIGIQLYSVGKPLTEDTAGTLTQVYAMGYREVETAGYAKKTAKEFRALLDAAGLVCPSAHLQLSGDGLDAQFDDAHALGAHYAVSSLLSVKDSGDSKAASTDPKAAALERFKRLAARMNELGKKANAAGLQYAYHNHNIEFQKMPDGTPGYDVLLKETDPELVKFEIDCGWMVIAGGSPVAYFKKYPGRFRMLHIKDFKPVSKPVIGLGGPDRPQGVDLGTGFVDYAPIFAAGNAAGIEHAFVEQEAPYPVSELVSVKNDVAFMQKFN